jgi:hypothetical protein
MTSIPPDTRLTIHLRLSERFYHKQSGGGPPSTQQASQPCSSECKIPATGVGALYDHVLLPLSQPHILEETPQSPLYPRVQMPIGPPMEEQPLFINAKQFDRIRKRRIARQELEDRIRLTKTNSPNVPETGSGCMRRPCGPGGRFLMNPDGSFLTGEQVTAMTQVEAILATQAPEGQCSNSADCQWMQARAPLMFLEVCRRCRRWKMNCQPEVFEKQTATEEVSLLQQ